MSCHFLSVAVTSASACHLRRVKFYGFVLAGGASLTSACPLPSSAASCLAAPHSGRAPPRRPSGPTGPASGPLLLTSPRWVAGAGGWGDRVEEGHCWSGGRGWDNPERGQKDGKWCVYGKYSCTGLGLGSACDSSSEIEGFHQVLRGLQFKEITLNCLCASNLFLGKVQKCKSLNSK